MPKNETVYELNEMNMKMLLGMGMTYLSCDNVCKTSINTNPTEFLNTLKFLGIPKYYIKLKKK